MRIKLVVCAVFISTTPVCFADPGLNNNTTQIAHYLQKPIVLADRAYAGQGRAGGRTYNRQRNPSYNGQRIQQYRDNHTYDNSYTFVNPIYPYGYDYNFNNNYGSSNYDYDNENANVDNPVFSTKDSNGNTVYYTTMPDGSLEYFTYDSFGNKVYVNGIH